MYQYLATVQELERRSREHKAVKSHFAKYAQPAPSETTMQAALRNAGVAGRNGGATAARA